MATKVETASPPPDDQALNKLRDKYKKELGLDNVETSLVAVLVSKGGQWWHIKEDGKLSDGAMTGRSFFEGRAWVSKGGQWWHIKEDGTKLSDERYDWVDSFSGGRARVKRGEQVWYIDLNGNRITDV